MGNKPVLNNATTWLLSVFASDLPAPAKLVAAYLRTHMNDHQECAWPSVARMAHMTSQSKRTVQNHLQTLCAKGWLENCGLSHHNTIAYGITTPPHVLHPDPPAGAAPPPQEIPKGGAGDAPELTNRINQYTSGAGDAPPRQKTRDRSFDDDLRDTSWA
jgi:hypothetical protein